MPFRKIVVVITGKVYGPQCRHRASGTATWLWTRYLSLHSVIYKTEVITVFASPVEGGMRYTGV